MFLEIAEKTEAARWIINENKWCHACGGIGHRFSDFHCRDEECLSLEIERDRFVSSRTLRNK